MFNQAMSGYTTQLVGAGPAAYDFSAFKTIVDIGAATEHCLLLFCGPIKQREASCLINHMWLPPPRHISWPREERSDARSLAVISSSRYRLAGYVYLLAQILHDWTINGAWPFSVNAAG